MNILLIPPKSTWEKEATFLNVKNAIKKLNWKELIIKLENDSVSNQLFDKILISLTEVIIKNNYNLRFEKNDLDNDYHLNDTSDYIKKFYDFLKSKVSNISNTEQSEYVFSLVQNIMINKKEGYYWNLSNSKNLESLPLISDIWELINANLNMSDLDKFKLKIKFFDDFVFFFKKEIIKDNDLKTILEDNQVLTLEDQIRINSLGLDFLKWLEKNGSKQYNNKFINLKDFGDKIKQIQESIVMDMQIHVQGFYGLGKTRIVIEAMKLLNINSNHILFYDLSYTDFKNIIMKLELLFDLNYKGYIIIQNCTKEIHSKIFNRMNKNSEISLITISSSLEEHNFKIPIISFDTNIDLTRNMIKLYFENINVPISFYDKIDTLNNWFQGFPILVYLYFDSFSGDLSLENMFELNIENFIKKIYNHETYKEKDIIKVLSFLSLFRKVKDDDKLIDYISKSIELDIKMIEDIIDIYIKNNIIKKIGNYLSIEPKVLALKLMQKWFSDNFSKIRGENTKNIKILELVASIYKNNLIDEFSEQLKHMGWSEDIKDIVNTLIEALSPLGKAIGIKSRAGSLLYRSFAKVEPEATVKSLYRIIMNMSIKELKEFKEGRRDIIWTLEELVFNEKTFEKAAKTLLRLAIAENEHYQNNSKGQFLSLFKLYLSGTEVNLIKRTKIIDYIFEKVGVEKNKDFKILYWNIGIEALEKILLNLSNFTKMTPNYKYDISVKKDFEPNYNEIIEYRKYAIDKILELIKNKSSNLIDKDYINKNYIKPYETFGDSNIISGGKIILPESIIVDMIRGYILPEEKERVINIVNDLIKEKNNNWSELLKIINELFSYNKNNIKKIGKEVLENWKQQLEGVLNFNELKIKDKVIYINKKIEQYVINPVIENTYKTDDGTYIDELDERLKGFVKELSITDIQYWKRELKPLLVQDLYKAYNFGKYLSKELSKNSKEFLKVLLDEIVNLVDNNEVSYHWFISGFISTLNRDHGNNKIISDFIDRLIKLKKYILVIDVIRSSYINNVEELFKILRIIDDKDNDININNLIVFTRNKPLDYLNCIDFIKFIKKLYHYGIEGYYQAFLITLHYNSFNEKHYSETKKELLKILKHQEVLYKISNGFYNYKSIITLLDDSKDEELASKLAKWIFNKELDTSSAFNFDKKSLAVYLIKKYFEISWKSLSLSLDNYAEHIYGLFYFLKYSNEKKLKPSILFENINDENYGLILNSCENKDLLRKTLIRIMPIYNIEENNNVFLTKFIIKIVNKFSENKEILESILEEVNRNLGTFSWDGSIIPYFERKHSIYELFKEKFPLNIQIENWADENIDFNNKAIKNELKREEEFEYFDL